MTQEIKKHIENISKLLSFKRKIIVITHHNPDGDALGSAIAIRLYLEKKGHEVTVISPNIYPVFLHWMHGNQDVIIFNQAAEKASRLISEADIIFFTDFNCLSRIKNVQKAVNESKAVKILIDHHPFPEHFADISITDTLVSSTSELVYDIICQSGDNNMIDKSIAECLFAGIITDTGTFSYNSSVPHTYEVVSDLLKSGIDKDWIHNSIYDNYSFDRMRLLGYCLYEKMVIRQEYRTGYIFITSEELRKFNYSPGDTEGFVNYPLSIKGLVFSAMFIEKKDHIKISFRSKNNFPSNQFAMLHFNGGGHLNAAGGESFLNLKETLLQFENLLEKYASQD
ncbi:MAG: bifunctional oligoribonuclease/PAP phosphatase NrnA [Bacteroidia bacterium]|nr:bifunctional oligoribonuclease/PAP phosphatase NrnA [Bacteroidia bacterium]